MMRSAGSQMTVGRPHSRGRQRCQPGHCLAELLASVASEASCAVHSPASQGPMLNGWRI